MSSASPSLSPSAMVEDKATRKVVQGSEKNHLQLLESDVSIRTEDGLLVDKEEQNGEGIQSSVVIGESSSTNRDVESGNFAPWISGLGPVLINGSGLSAQNGEVGVQAEKQSKTVGPSFSSPVLVETGSFAGSLNEVSPFDGLLKQRCGGTRVIFCRKRWWKEILLENHPSGRHSSKMGKKKSLKISTNLTKGEGSKFKSRAQNRIPIAKAVNLVVNRLDDGVSKEELGSKNEDNFTVKNVSNLDV
ncbi:hypothetical protein GOBAR_AA15646 [Gossypium barbadense]|uniref:Uncharacterized protein n=1 Tax=Gossypium barbadense TaxID=3634 RepID=A0A2P5XNV8_GOSBA|nr:hypothetical protein GOBAR_AA15646 [Gossypium barbadense]